MKKTLRIRIRQHTYYTDGRHWYYRVMQMGASWAASEGGQLSIWEEELWVLE